MSYYDEVMKKLGVHKKGEVLPADPPPGEGPEDPFAGLFRKPSAAMRAAVKKPENGVDIFKGIFRLEGSHADSQ